MQKPKLLVIDDEEGIRISLRGILEDEGYLVHTKESAEEALLFFEKESVDLIFLDVWLQGMDGLSLMDYLHETIPETPVIMISGHGTIETAVAAIKKGAYDFIEKPLSLEKIIITVERALDFIELKKENLRLKQGLREDNIDAPMGVSNVVNELKEQIFRVSPLDTWVLITGENGTGKELVARAIHNNSKRKNKSLVAVNCAAIPEELIESELFGHEKGAFTGADSSKVGKFELAYGGTLFLDEIGDMSLKTQAKILRILQEKTFERVGSNRTLYADVRVIAATNKDLELAICNGEFREDLYYRLRVFPIHVPPLRERGNDIILLSKYFSESIAQNLGLLPIVFSSEAAQSLIEYSWPGNVRELKNFIERTIILHSGKTIEVSMLPQEFHNKEWSSFGGKQKKLTEDNFTVEGSTIKNNLFFDFQKGQKIPDDFKNAKSAFESCFLTIKLQEYNGNISKLAEAIGLERTYLYRKLKAYNIQGTN